MAEHLDNHVETQIVFCFAGQGYIPTEAARDLYRAVPTFSKIIQQVDEALKRFFSAENEPEAFNSVSEYLLRTDPPPPNITSFDNEDDELDGAASDQKHPNAPTATLLIFASQLALSRTLQDDYDIHPWAVVGYSLGEYVAAAATGSIPLAECVELLCRRDRLFADRSLVPVKGGMVTVQTNPDEFQDIMLQEGIAGIVDISGFPHPNSTVLSGNADKLDLVQEVLDRHRVENQRRNIPLGMHADHVNLVAQRSRQDENMEPDHKGESRVKAGIKYWSTLGRELVTGTPLNANYWATLLRQPIHFKQCIGGIYDTSTSESTLVYLDMGMGPRLGRLIQNTLQETTRWKDGSVKTVAAVQSIPNTVRKKEEEGWAKKALEKCVSQIRNSDTYIK